MLMTLIRVHSFLVIYGRVLYICDIVVALLLHLFDLLLNGLMSYQPVIWIIGKLLLQIFAHTKTWRVDVSKVDRRAWRQSYFKTSSHWCRPAVWMGQSQRVIYLHNTGHLVHADNHSTATLWIFSDYLLVSLLESRIILYGLDAFHCA